MSDLLRHPATVPALFSRAMDADAPAARAPSPWHWLTANAPLVAMSGWAAVMLIDVPLVKAATAVASLALPR